MPVHDSGRVDANIFHHFHQRWTIAICDALNAGLLPPRYSALVEQSSYGTVSDVLAARANRIGIRHRLDEVVCVIELVSPGNKSGNSALRAFVEKSISFLRNGIHLLIIDILPPTLCDPHGIHKVIWDEFEEIPFELPSGKSLTLAAYTAGSLLNGIETAAYIDCIGKGDLIPNMPAFLDRERYVSVSLESSYQTSWESCPADMRVLVETGKLPGEEAKDEADRPDAVLDANLTLFVLFCSA